MKTEDFSTTLVVDATTQQVFEAINNVRGWWSENIEGDTDKPAGEFLYHYQDVHRARMKITEFTPGKKVVWHVLDNYFKFTEDESEWKGTNIIFEINEKEGKTVLTFTHEGLVPAYECYEVCHDAWTHYIQDSLKNLILTGAGSPTPKQVEENADNTLSTDGVTGEDASAKCICHRLLIKAPVEKVYEALTTQQGLAGWWTPETTARPEVGSLARFAFGPDYYKIMKIEQLNPYDKVKWICREGREEWIGTTISFDLEPNNKGCSLSFRHDGWKAYTIEFSSCSYDWALFMRSLKLLCETGKGIPYPNFNK